MDGLASLGKYVRICDGHISGIRSGYIDGIISIFLLSLHSAADLPMKIPNGDRAYIDVENKLIGYSLNVNHPSGGHKARVFAASLGLTAENATILRDALLVAILEQDFIQTRASEHGQHYVIDFEMRVGERQAVVRSAWIIEVDKDFPRLTSCYVL